jgi:mannose-6-phosphate isomerase-like protein (cupin superfamily)
MEFQGQGRQAKTTKRENVMARLRIAVPAAIAVSVIALLAPNVRAQAQEPAGSAKPAAPALEFGWAPKKSPYDNYDAPNKVWWKLSDILAAHSKTASWVQPVVRNKDMQADWHQLAAGEKTALTEWPDNRVGMIVWQGQVRISIKGQEPFVASRGFELNIPLRLPYTMQTLGDQPALWLEVHQAGDVAIYPVEGTPEKPKDIPGYTYTKVVLSGGDGVYDAGNKPYLDYYKDVVNGGVRAGAFIASDHFFMNNIRGMGVAMPPATDLGHFHVDMTEFWFVMEGKIDYQIEGLPTPFTAEAGDIVTAAMGRYHRASFSAGQMDTRVAINPFPRGLHDFPEASGGHQ